MTQAEVPDVRVARGQQALHRLAEKTKFDLQDWREYGEALQALRERAGTSRAELGRLVKEAGLGASPAQDNRVRSDALWLADHWEDYTHSAYSSYPNMNHPHYVRQWCRKQKFAWAAPPVDPNKPAKAKKPKLTKVDLTEANKRLLEKTIAAEKATLDKLFSQQVQTAVKAALPDAANELARLKALAVEEIKAYGMRSHGIGPHLSEENYKFLLGVLHPDREPTVEQRQKGFTIVRGLEPYMAAFRKHRKD